MFDTNSTLLRHYCTTLTRLWHSFDIKPAASRHSVADPTDFDSNMSIFRTVLDHKKGAMSAHGLEFALSPVGMALVKMLTGVNLILGPMLRVVPCFVRRPKFGPIPNFGPISANFGLNRPILGIFWAVQGELDHFWGELGQFRERARQILGRCWPIWGDHLDQIWGDVGRFRSSSGDAYRF